MVPYWAEVTHEEVWTHHHPWYALEHAVTSWMNPRTVRIVGRTVGQIFEELIDQRGWQTVLGVAMVGLGVGMLIPGPLDVLAFGIGFAVGGGPAGGVVGVVAYNLLALVVLGVGLGLIYFD